MARDRVECMVGQTLDRIVVLRKSVIEVIADNTDVDGQILRALLATLTGTLARETAMLRTLENARDDLSVMIVRGKGQPDLQVAA